MTHTQAAAFAVMWIAIYTGHNLADFWLQTASQADRKGVPGRAGHAACLRHVATVTACITVTIILAAAATGCHPRLLLLAAGLAVNAASHYAADLRRPLKKIAALAGKTSYWQLGEPRDGHDDNPCGAPGRLWLDQVWHLTWLFITALIIVA